MECIAFCKAHFYNTDKSVSIMTGITQNARERMERMLADYPKKELCHLMYIGKVATYNKKWSNETGYSLAKFVKVNIKRAITIQIEC